MVGQSIVLGQVEAETPLQNESPMNDQIIWQQYIQQVESLSPENRVSKFCVNTIHPEPEIHEQIYMTKGYGTLCTTTSTFSLTLSAL